MHRSCFMWFSAALALVVAAPLARATVPAPPNTSVDACLLLEPGGSIPFTVVVRDFASNPIAGSFVAIDYCECPGVVLCPSAPGMPNQTHVECIIEGTTDATGTRVFKLKGGGGCGGIVRVYADGVLLAQIRAASPDQNGDLSVDAGDTAILATKVGTSDLTGDLNCDGVVTPADQSVQALYMGRTCLTPTPTRRATWADLKILYR